MTATPGSSIRNSISICQYKSTLKFGEFVGTQPLLASGAMILSRAFKVSYNYLLCSVYIYLLIHSQFSKLGHGE